jgi:acetyl-CoA acetyltransferase
MSKQPVTRSAFGRDRKALLRFQAAAFVAAALTLTAWAWIITAGKDKPVPTASAAVVTLAPARSLPTQDRVEAETVALSSTGFEPTEIRRPAGRALLAVNNLSGLDEATIRLEGEGGQVLQEVTLERHQQKWRKVIDFTAGTYTLTVAGHPEWRCQIFIY